MKWTALNFPDPDDGPRWAEMNQRRFQLIQKRTRLGGLEGDEKTEYDLLQRLACAAARKKYPQERFINARADLLLRGIEIGRRK